MVARLRGVFQNKMPEEKVSANVRLRIVWQLRQYDAFMQRPEHDFTTAATDQRWTIH
jgi:hypothetical protein